MKSLSSSIPHIIAMVGVPGAGKTYFAQQFSETFSAPFLCCHYLQPLSDSDEYIHTVTLDLLSEIAKTKKTIIYEGQTDRRVDRTELAQLARQYGYKVLFVWVQTDLVTARNRSQKNLPTNMFEERVNTLSPPHEKEPHVVISGRHTYSTQARTILKRISEDLQSKTTTATRAPAPKPTKPTPKAQPDITEPPSTSASTSRVTRSAILSRPPIGRGRS